MNHNTHEKKITHGTHENKMTHGTLENRLTQGTRENKMTHGNFWGEINCRFYPGQNNSFQNRSRQQKSDENQKHEPQSMTAKMKRIGSNGGTDLEQSWMGN